jgi:hypothetical protein
MGLLSCFLSIALIFKVSKWIRKPKKRALLVTVFQSILEKHREKSCSKGKMPEFCALASKQNLSPGDFMELQEMLQEISNMEGPTYLPMRWFLGHRTIIGGNRWNRAKMENFLLHVNRWNGTQNGARSFRNTHFNDLTSNDIIQQGHNGGGIREVEILQTAANGGKLPVTPRSSSDARRIALTTPRSGWKEAAARSVGSTPLNTPRGNLTSSSSSVGATPLNSPRPSLASSCSSLHLSTPPPPSMPSIFLQWLIESGKQGFSAAMKEACNGMTYQHPFLVQLFDIVRHHQMFFNEMTLNSPITQSLFFKKLSNCVLIQRTLSASPLFKSIEHVASADDLVQIMFIEGLVASFFLSCKKGFVLGISKIVLKPDGNDFSIELFPDSMIQDYLNQFKPSRLAEQLRAA